MTVTSSWLRRPILTRHVISTGASADPSSTAATTAVAVADDPSLVRVWHARWPFAPPRARPCGGDDDDDAAAEVVVAPPHRALPAALGVCFARRPFPHAGSGADAVAADGDSADGADEGRSAIDAAARAAVDEVGPRYYYARRIYNTFFLNSHKK